MSKRVVVLAVLLALVMVILFQVVALAGPPSVPTDIPARSPDDLIGVFKKVMGYVTLGISILLVGIAVILGAWIAWSGINVRPQQRAEAVTGIFYLLLGAAVSFGASWWLGLAKGLLQ